MRIETKLVAAALGAATLWASPAYAQATRTWVSGVGDDVNPCSRTAPCKTFAGAISKTAANGEINCLDPAGFGTVTITKSMTIDCTGTFGSVLNAGGVNGIIINDSTTVTPGTIEVKLRGLSINGAGATPGLNGIRFVTGRSLVVEDVFIISQKSGAGILLQPTGPIRVLVNNVTITDGGTGILVQPTGNGLVRALIRNTRAQGNTNQGLRVDTTSATVSNSGVTVEDSSFSSNAAGVSVNSGSSFVTVSVNGSALTNNTGVGVEATGFSSNVMVGDSTITGNATGVSMSGGSVVRTFGDNRNEGNPNFVAPNNGAFFAPALTKK